jgi:hypothetical protein
MAIFLMACSCINVGKLNQGAKVVVFLHISAIANKYNDIKKAKTKLRQA